MWTDQDLYLLQENMREGTLPVKDREKTLIPGRESLGLGLGMRAAGLPLSSWKLFQTSPCSPRREEVDGQIG